MVELINNDEVVELRRDLIGEVLAVVALDRDKKVIHAVRAVRPHQKISEVPIPQHAPETGQALLQNLLPMRDEEQSWIPLAVLRAECLREPLIIEGSHHGLAR